MKITANEKRIVGANVLAYIQSKDSQLKTTKSTTAGVAEGLLTFPNDTKKWEILQATYIGRDGNVRDYPCIICKDSAGEEVAIALTAFREKDPIVTPDKTIGCQNVCEFDASYQDIWDALTKNKDKIRLHRVIGRRNNFKGRYEYFTIDD